ncbi:MAG: phenylalanine--tRNA ligase subunit alpha [Candidatus Helarchaeota archaeon]
MSTYDVNILEVLKNENDYITPIELAMKANLKLEQVQTILPRLEYYKAIEIKDEISEYIFLTKEGKKYLDQGLPEIILLKYISKSECILTKELKSSDLEDFVKKIGINWAKKKNYIEFKKKDKESIICLTSLGKDVINKGSQEEKFINLFRSVPEILTKNLDKEYNKIINEFRERGLIDSRSEKNRFVKIRKGVNIEDFRIKEITRLTQDIIKNKEWKKRKIKEFDISLSPRIVYSAKRQPYLEFLDEVRYLLIGMGFKEYKGPFVEAEFYNFDCLNQAQDHPAREIHDSYILKKPKEAVIKDMELVERVKQTHENGWKTNSSGWGYKWSFDLARRLILRSQTTAVSVRTILKEKKPPIKMFTLDRVFRPDVLDAKHAQEFDQCEGIVLGENLNLQNLLGILKEFAFQLGFKEIKFKPGFFPFTSPSVEAFVKHEKLGWMEILGSGLFRPEVLIPLGIDYPKVQCLAWGVGIGRLAMVRLGLNDIRALHSQDLNYLRNSTIIIKK